MKHYITPSAVRPSPKTAFPERVSCVCLVTVNAQLMLFLNYRLVCRPPPGSRCECDQGVPVKGSVALCQPSLNKRTGSSFLEEGSLLCRSPLGFILKKFLSWWGTKDSGCPVPTVKPLEANLWFVTLSYINKTDASWLGFRAKMQRQADITLQSQDPTFAMYIDILIFLGSYWQRE